MSPVRSLKTNYVAGNMLLNNPVYVPKPPVSGYALWLDASNSSSFSFSSGNQVSQWSDLSGNGYHFTQSSGSIQPTRSGTQNGQSTVVFNGSSQYMTAPTTTGLNPTSWTICAVTYSTATSAYQRILGKRDGSNGAGNEGVAFGYSASNHIYAVARNLSNATGANLLNASGGENIIDPTSSVASSGQWVRYTSAFGTTANELDEWVGGSITAYSTGAGSQAVTNTAPFSLGGLYTGGWTEFFNGQLAELIIYTSALTSTQITSVQTYLKNKWNTAA